ncbi:MAG: 2-C-methyl-D-erythritol 4-phosphate cytidylyltransferase [Huintestinicola sp.]
MDNIKNIGVILSGGKGLRAGGNIPKQYQSVNGRMIIEYVAEAFRNSKETDLIIIAADKAYHSLLDPLQCECIEGGKERNDTVRNVLDHIKEKYPKCEKVLFHDSARPMIISEYIDECFTLLDEHYGVITTSRITDSLGKVNSGPVERSDYYLIQTPEAFRFNILEKNFSSSSEWTAIVQQLPEDTDIFRNFNLTKNMKITYPEDFMYFSYITESRTTK